MRVVMWIVLFMSLLMFFVGMGSSISPKRDTEDRKVDLITTGLSFVFLVVLMVLINPNI